MEIPPSDNNFEITESNATPESTAENLTAIEQSETKLELSKAKRMLYDLGKAAVVAGAYSGSVVGLYVGMRTGTFDSMNVHIAPSENSQDQLVAAVEYTAAIGAIVPVARSFFGKRKK